MHCDSKFEVLLLACRFAHLAHDSWAYLLCCLRAASAQQHHWVLEVGMYMTIQASAEACISGLPVGPWVLQDWLAATMFQSVSGLHKSVPGIVCVHQLNFGTATSLCCDTEHTYLQLVDSAHETMLRTALVSEPVIMHLYLLLQQGI